MADATDCQSAIGNEVLLAGYSEGSYAAVAVLEALATAETDLQVQTSDAQASSSIATGSSKTKGRK